MINPQAINDILNEKFNLSTSWIFGRSVARELINESMGEVSHKSSFNKRNVIIVCGLIDQSVKSKIEQVDEDQSHETIAYIFVGNDSLNGLNLLERNLFFTPDQIVEKPLLLNDSHLTDEAFVKLLSLSVNEVSHESH